MRSRRETMRPSAAQRGPPASDLRFPVESVASSNAAIVLTDSRAPSSPAPGPRHVAPVRAADQFRGGGGGGERRIQSCRIRHALTLRRNGDAVNGRLTAAALLPTLAPDDRCPGPGPGLIGKPVRESLAIPALPPQR